MKIEYDPNKSNKNLAERGFAFDAIIDFDWESAVLKEDIRKKYPERRFVATGFIDERLHVVCFTPVFGGIRVISLRKANKRESENYEKTINQ